MNLVLFDFDGTITRDDSLLEFVAYVVGFKKFFRGILVLSPILAAYKLGLASNNFTRRKLLGYFFAGMSADKFDKICKKYHHPHRRYPKTKRDGQDRNLQSRGR